jgi:hypothetical protein
MALIVGMFAVLLAFAAVARADYAVNACGSYPNDVFTLFRPADGSVTTTNFNCPAGGFLPEVNSNEAIAGAAGDRGGWQATAPAGLEIVAASVPNGSLSAIMDGGWSGGPYWRGGGADVTTNTQGGTWSGFASPFFGFELACPSSCAAPGNAVVDVMAVSLNVRETVRPSFTASSGLWQANGWVRGAWPLDFSGDSPSGVCALSGTLNGIPFNGTSVAAATTATWHQCSAPAVSTTINTASYGQGPVPLILVGRDAAGNVGSASKTVNVDNSVPSLSLSGPADAPSTAGTQFVTATAGGSPSGIDQIACSVDGGPAQPYPGAVAHVPVSGLGEHQVSCTAYNNAVDPNGVRGASQTQARSIKIGTPTTLDVTFARLAGLRCKLEKRHHKGIGVTTCHLERRGGVQHKSVAPHLKAKAKKHVRYGRAAAVSGWLGLADGSPLSGRTVKVLTAPDDDTGRFTLAAEVTTAANGTWTLSLPAGPSRLIKATYAGSSTTLQSISGQVNLLVPAKVELMSVTPGRVAWGQAVAIKGQLVGGYLPTGGVNVRLRIGIANAKTTFGVRERVSGTGNFTATYTFGPGNPGILRTYWFQIASLPAGDYPYTPAASNRIYVQVGGHP